MGDLTAPVATVVAAVIGGVIAFLSARRMRQLGLGDDQQQVNRALRELADTWEEKFNLVTADLVTEKASHAATAQTLALEKALGSQCREDLDNARARLRADRRTHA